MASPAAAVPARLHGAYGRMNDPLKITTRLRIGEDDLAQGGAIQPAVAQHVVAEAFLDRGQAGGPRLDHLTREHVGVDHHGPVPGQFIGHHALARRDAAR